MNKIEKRDIIYLPLDRNEKLYDKLFPNFKTDINLSRTESVDSDLKIGTFNTFKKPLF